MADLIDGSALIIPYRNYGRELVKSPDVGALEAIVENLGRIGGSLGC